MNEEYITSIPSPEVGPSSETGDFVSEHYIIDAIGRYIAYVVYENAVRVITWMEDIQEWGTPNTYFDKDEARKAYVHAIENGAKEAAAFNGKAALPTGAFDSLKVQVDAYAQKKQKNKYDQYVQEHMKDMMEEAMKAYTKEYERSTYDNYALEA